MPHISQNADKIALGGLLGCDIVCVVLYALSAKDMADNVPPIAVLPLPAEDDDLVVLNAKLSSYLYVVHVGNSIAAATGLIHGVPTREPPESRAIDEMRPHEREYYEAWKERSPLSLPCIDWDADRGRTPTSQRPLKKAARRAEALNRIYSTERAEPCHYTHFTENHPLWVPLVTAVARVIGAERHQQETSTKLKAYSHDFQLVQKIVQSSLQVVSRAEDGPTKIRVQEKVRFLQSCIRSKEQASGKTLGKRKHREEELFDSGEEPRTPDRSRAVVQDPYCLGRVESSVARRPKTS